MTNSKHDVPRSLRALRHKQETMQEPIKARPFGNICLNRCSSIATCHQQGDINKGSSTGDVSRGRRRVSPEGMASMGMYSTGVCQQGVANGHVINKGVVNRVSATGCHQRRVVNRVASVSSKGALPTMYRQRGRRQQGVIKECVVNEASLKGASPTKCRQRGRRRR